MSRSHVFFLQAQIECLNSQELLEIKCPLLIKKCESLTEMFSGKLTNVKLVHGVPQLQPNGARGYYMKVQMDMFCTGLERCASS